MQYLPTFVPAYLLRWSVCHKIALHKIAPFIPSPSCVLRRLPLVAICCRQPRRPFFPWVTVLCPVPWSSRFCFLSAHHYSRAIGVSADLDVCIFPIAKKKPKRTGDWRLFFFFFFSLFFCFCFVFGGVGGVTALL